MATEAQMNANRANAQKFSGPATAEGKTRASQNALKTGIFAESEVLFTENPEELAQLIAEYYTEHNPTTPEARALVDDLVEDEWHKRRLRRGEARYFNHLYTRLEATPAEHREGHVIELGILQIARIHRMRESLRRGSKITLDMLRQLKPAPEPEPEPAAVPNPEAAAAAPKSSTAQPAESETTSPEIGFVSSSGEKFASEAAWRLHYKLKPGHPFDYRECPTCTYWGRIMKCCTHEAPKAPEQPAEPVPTGPPAGTAAQK